MGVAVTKRRHHEAAVSINIFVRILGGSMVLKTTTLQIATEFSDDAILNDKICILDALHRIHLRAFQLSDICRQNSR